MPELPEVQTTVNGINRYTRGLVINDVWTSYDSKFHYGKEDIKDPKYFSKFKKSVVGTKIRLAERRGKNILIHLDTDMTVLVHMKMTGHFLYGKYTKCETLNVERKKKTEWVATEAGPLRDDPFNRHVRLLFYLSNKKSLALSDTRKFAKITLIDSDTLHDSEHIRHHGPEPLDEDFTLAKFEARLRTKPNWPIKKTLMDLTVVSGIGNIYSDEILWLAGVHPLTRTTKIGETGLRAIYIAMKKSLLRGIDFGGDSMSDYRNIEGLAGKFQDRHNAYQKTGERCARRGCRGTIRRIIAAGRSAHYCDRHQRLVR
jgi:formamidopyrimidine-DNA glycosylase